MISREELEQWKHLARRDDWHTAFVGSDIRMMLSEIERLMLAIRSTASDGTYDEGTIRKAVSFELAELIVDARRALEQKP